MPCMYPVFHQAHFFQHKRAQQVRHDTQEMQKLMQTFLSMEKRGGHDISLLTVELLAFGNFWERKIQFYLRV